MMRKTIARRLVEAKQTIPHFYLTSDCDAAPLLAFRAALNATLTDETKISVNDLIVKACAIALRRLPQVNAAFLGDRIRQFGRVHIGVAVSIDDGLVTPVVRDTDMKGLGTINAEIRDLAARAKHKKLAPEEMTGSTFTVSNLGMYGIDHFQAVINPPEACILAVGAVKKQPVVGADGQLAVGQRMALTLSCDHRVVDGALGARWLAELVKILEQPASLAL
jgi:pyruvate dehydrogenase E2 component (dihydrolipoamide acetyltransferase)